MPTSLIAYLSTVVVFFGMDFAWLSLAVGPIYKANLGSLMLEKPNLPVAAGFYLLYVIAMVVFAVLPAIAADSWVKALWAGALLGISAYGAYDLTNLATIAGWSVTVTVVDMAWGTFATGVASVAGFFITKAFL